MLRIEDTMADVGVIIGRFQVHTLHEAHIELIDTVKERHERVIVFLGLSPLRNTSRNPLDFKARKNLINEHYEDIDVFYIDDVPDDVLWSKKLDEQVKKWTNPGESVVLYGSRDSFISKYHGINRVCRLESDSYISGSEIRKKIKTNYLSTEPFRAGIISATGQRYKVAYQTIDVAIIDENKVLLARKPNEEKWRFIGGFSSVDSNSQSAQRWPLQIKFR